jgi:hypothetical protein
MVASMIDPRLMTLSFQWKMGHYNKFAGKMFSKIKLVGNEEISSHPITQGLSQLCYQENKW